MDAASTAAAPSIRVLLPGEDPLLFHGGTTATVVEAAVRQRTGLAQHSFAFLDVGSKLVYAAGVDNLEPGDYEVVVLKRS